MSYHRVLPPLPDSVATKGFVEQDTLLRHKIMPTQSSRFITERTKSLTLSERSSSPVPEKDHPSSGEESVEDSVDSPNLQSQSPSQTTSNRGDQRLGKRLPIVSKPIPGTWQGESPSQICLCQPDPKVPRPRNAFILYRQHHQAAVVAQNPGLANPEISKVIGDQWRRSPDEVKAHWKLIAEEEKLRHQKQYPDYRYQPRRSGRKNSLSNALETTNAGEAENRRCPKCGGRSITAATHMMSNPSHSSNNPAVSSPFSPNHPPSTPTTGSSAHRFLNNLDSPRLNGPSGLRSRPAASSGKMSGLQLASPRFKRPGPSEFPLSPDIKRRRANGPYPIRPSTDQPTPYPYPFPPHRRESLPRPDFMPSRHNGTFAMGPPPRPHPQHPDSSLTLPPLQTSSAALDSAASARAKSLEAMVMSIPILNKIRVLAKISPPLSSPGPTSPIHQTRGFVIAIDGSDPTVVSQITSTLSTSLTAHHPVRTFHGPELARARGDAPRNESSGDDFPSYLSIIAEYHDLSNQIQSFITTDPSPLPSRSSPPTSPVSPRTGPSSKPVTRSTASQQRQHDPAPSASPSPAGVPIALLPSFQLSHTDAAASQIPIADEYAPVDHWQWMATLWRGIIGPDVTIAVVPTLPIPPPISATSNASDGKSLAGGPLLGSKGGGGTEVRLDDARAIVVRGDEKGTVPEGVLRRVVFEISEWVRSKEDAGSRRNS